MENGDDHQYCKDSGGLHDFSPCQTYAFTVLGLSQLFHAVGMRDVEKSVFRMNPVNNLLMILAVVIGFALQIMVTEQTGSCGSVPDRCGLQHRVEKTSHCLQPCRFLPMSFLSSCPGLAGDQNRQEIPAIRIREIRTKMGFVTAENIIKVGIFLRKGKWGIPNREKSW